MPFLKLVWDLFIEGIHFCIDTVEDHPNWAFFLIVYLFIRQWI